MDVNFNLSKFCYRGAYSFYKFSFSNSPSYHLCFSSYGLHKQLPWYIPGHCKIVDASVKHGSQATEQVVSLALLPRAWIKNWPDVPS